MRLRFYWAGVAEMVFWDVALASLFFFFPLNFPCPSPLPCPLRGWQCLAYSLRRQMAGQTLEIACRSLSVFVLQEPELLGKGSLRPWQVFWPTVLPSWSPEDQTELPPSTQLEAEKRERQKRMGKTCFHHSLWEGCPGRWNCKQSINYPTSGMTQKQQKATRDIGSPRRDESKRPIPLPLSQCLALSKSPELWLFPVAGGT